MVVDTYAVLSWLATYAVHSTALLLFVWALTSAIGGLSLRRASTALVRERLWKIAIVGGVLTATLASLLPGKSWLPDVEFTPPTAAQVVEAPAPARPEPSFAALETSSLDARVAALEAPPPATFQPALWSQIEPAVEPAPSWNVPWAQIVLGTWAIGALIGIAKWIGEWRRLFRCLAGRVDIASGPARIAWMTLVERHPPARSVRLTRAAHLPVPITLGFLRREICLPPAAETALQPDEIRAVLGHELAHAIRRDPLWLCVCRAFEIVFFFQPLNRLARARLQDECESLCDDWSVVHTGERVALASSLAEIAGWLLDSPPALPAPGMVVHRSRLSQRVQRLLDADHRPELSLHALRWSFAAAVPCASVALAVPAVSIHGGASERIESMAFEDGAPLLADRVASGAPLFVAPALLAARTAVQTAYAAAECPSLLALGEPESLDAQIDALEAELEELQEAGSELVLSCRAKERLAELAERVESVRALQERMHEILERIPDREPTQ